MAIRPTDPLRNSVEKQIGISIPTPLDTRLDALVRLAIAAGDNTSRKELLSALLLAAPDDPAKLITALRSYRVAQVGQAAIAGDDVNPYLGEPETRPGPRPRRG